MALRLTFERWPANALGYGHHQIRGHHKRQPPRWFSCPCRGCTSSSNRWSQPRSSRPSSSRLQFLFRRDAGVFLVLFALMPRNWITNINKCSQYAFGFQRPSFAGQNKTVETKRLPNCSSKRKPRGGTFQHNTNTPGGPKSPWGVAYIFPRCRVPRK